MISFRSVGHPQHYTPGSKEEWRERETKLVKKKKIQSHKPIFANLHCSSPSLPVTSWWLTVYLDLWLTPNPFQPPCHTFLNWISSFALCSKFFPWIHIPLIPVHSLLLPSPRFSDAVAFVSPGSVRIPFLVTLTGHPPWLHLIGFDCKASKPGALGSPHAASKSSRAHRSRAPETAGFLSLLAAVQLSHI